MMRIAAMATLGMAGLVGVIACRTDGRLPPASSSVFPRRVLDQFSDRWYSGQLRAAAEDRLRPSGIAGHEIYRFTIIPSFIPTVTITVRRRGDEYTLTAKRLTGAGGYEPGTLGAQRERSLSAAQGALLQQWVTDMSFWQMPTREPPVQQPPGVEVVYLDGTVWLLEAVDAHRYHLVDREHPRETSHAALGNAAVCLLLWSGAFDQPEPWFTMDEADVKTAANCGARTPYRPKAASR
jgi:hypothetical protein